MNHQHMIMQSAKPQRFEEFEEFQDKKGFVIRENGRTIDFYYDDEGGWFDEYGNYYNKSGKPTLPSNKNTDFWEDIKGHYMNNNQATNVLFTSKLQKDQDLDAFHVCDATEDQINEYEHGFTPCETESEENDFLREEEINKLLRILKTYESDKPIKIYFNGVRAKCSIDEVKQFFGVENIIDVQFEYKGKFKTGKGNLIVKDRNSAKGVVRKHCSELDGEEVNLQIEPLGFVPSEDEDESIEVTTQASEIKRDPLEMENSIEPQPHQNIQQLTKQQQAYLPNVNMVRKNNTNTPNLSQACEQYNSLSNQTLKTTNNTYFFQNQTNLQIDPKTTVKNNYLSYTQIDVAQKIDVAMIFNSRQVQYQSNHKQPEQINNNYPSNNLQSNVSKIQQQPLQRKPVEGLDLLFSNIPLAVTDADFEEWLQLKVHEKKWILIRSREERKMRCVKVTFKDIKSAEQVLNFFDSPQHLMFKGRSRLTVVQMWKN